MTHNVNLIRDSETYDEMANGKISMCIVVKTINYYCWAPMQLRLNAKDHERENTQVVCQQTLRDGYKLIVC